MKFYGFHREGSRGLARAGVGMVFVARRPSDDLF